MLLTTHISTYFDAQLFSIHQDFDINPAYCQFLMVLSGSISICAPEGTYLLKSKDFYLLMPGNDYKITAGSDNFILSIEISKSFIDTKIDMSKQVLCHSYLLTPGADEMRDILTTLMVTFHRNSTPYNKLSIFYTNLFRLITCLRNYYLTDLNQDGADGTQKLYLQRRTQILNYLHRNFQLSINLQNLADQMFLSPQYLSKFIRQQFGQTFYKLLSGIRMEHALLELSQTENPITTIAFNNGFASLNAFNKAFKEYFDLTPSQYRQSGRANCDGFALKNAEAITTESYQKVQDLIMPEGSSEAQSVTDKDPRTSIQIATAVPPQPLNPIWNELINLGPAHYVLSQSFQELFREAHKNLRFRYARIENIFDDDIIFQISDSQEYNFTHIDMILDFLTECNTLPFLELSTKSKKTYITALSNGAIHEPLPVERDESYFLQAFEALLRHCINRYGMNKVSKWRFELWAPHEKALLYKASPAKYVRRFKSFRDILKRYVPEALLGGPGFNTSSYLDYFLGFLDEFERRKIYPDFISLYLFSFEMSNAEVELQNLPDNSPCILSPDADRFKHCVASLRQAIAERLSQHPPIIVTEFNSDIMANNYTIYSCFQAAFICKNAIDLINQVQGFGYYIFSSQSTSNQMIRRRWNTDLGLIGLHEVKNPSYFAFEFLNKLGRQVISKGDNYIITSDSADRFQILAYNYSHFTPYFCLNFYDYVDIAHTYDIFDDKGDLTLNLELTSLQSGRYKIISHVLNRRHGSVIDRYMELLEDASINPTELLYMLVNLQATEAKYYQSTCIPKQMIAYRECAGTLPLKLSLAPHEVIFLEIVRKV